MLASYIYFPFWEDNHISIYSPITDSDPAFNLPLLIKKKKKEKK